MEGHVLLPTTGADEAGRLKRRLRPRRDGWVATDTLLHVRSQVPVQLIDLTDALTDFAHRSHLRTGWVSVQVLHTTAALFLNEDEPLLKGDLVGLLERLAPRRSDYAHDDFSRRRDLEPEERANGHAHAKALLLRASETIHVVDGAPRLGRYQRLFLAELDGPRERDVSMVALGAR
jgi:secondary thiamine-phosphate synthase enzyme